VTSPEPFSIAPKGGSNEPFSVKAPAAPEVPFARAPRIDEPTPRRRIPKWQRWLAGSSSVVVLVACVLLGFSFWETRVSGWLAERSQQELRSAFSSRLASERVLPVDPALRPAANTPTRTPSADGTLEPKPPALVYPKLPATGELVGRLSIPAIELDWMIVAGTDPDTLKKGPGAWLYGAFPGAPGNATLSGHRTTYGGPFRRLGDLQKGDKIMFDAPDGSRSVFEVRGMGVVSPKDVYVTEEVPGVRLTLLTCDPPGTAARRLVVQAELIEGPFVGQALPSNEWSFLNK
jgi:sortase A